MRACTDDAPKLLHCLLKAQRAARLQHLPQRADIQCRQCPKRLCCLAAERHGSLHHLLHRIAAARQLGGGSAKCVGIQHPAARSRISRMDAAHQVRLGQVQFLRPCTGAQASSLQHRAKASIQQQGLELAKQFMDLHSVFPSFDIHSAPAKHSGRIRHGAPAPDVRPRPKGR